MTIRSSYQVHFDSGDVRHVHSTFSVLEFREGGGSYVSVHFGDDPALIDEVIAELVALRAEMTGDAERHCLQPGDHSAQLAGSVIDCKVTGHHTDPLPPAEVPVGTSTAVRF